MELKKVAGEFAVLQEHLALREQEIVDLKKKLEKPKKVPIKKKKKA